MPTKPWLVRARVVGIVPGYSEVYNAPDNIRTSNEVFNLDNHAVPSNATDATVL